MELREVTALLTVPQPRVAPVLLCCPRRRGRAALPVHAVAQHERQGELVRGRFPGLQVEMAETVAGSATLPATSMSAR